MYSVIETSEKDTKALITSVQANQIISYSYFHQLNEEPKREKRIWMESECLVKGEKVRKGIDAQEQTECAGMLIILWTWKIYIFTVVPGCNSTNTADRRLFAAKRVFIYMHIVSCVYFINVHKECSRRSYAVVLCFVHNKCGKYSSVRSHIVMCMDSTFIQPRGRDRGKKPSTKSVLTSSAAISQWCRE